MVYHIFTFALPGDCFWPYRPDHSRHALQDENPEAPDGRPPLL